MAERLSQGVLDIEVHVATHDEMGELSQSLGNVVQSFREITTTSQAIARGDLSHQVTPRSEYDELGSALQEMTSYLNEMATTATMIATGDLTHTLPVRSAGDTFGHVMQSMNEGLRALIQQIRTSAEQLADTVEHDILGTGRRRIFRCGTAPGRYCLWSRRRKCVRSHCRYATGND